MFIPPHKKQEYNSPTKLRGDYMKQVRKAIITAAGYGTRFLPATKNIPKEMLPLIDVPIIHEIVKECIDAGIDQIIIVTRYGNNAVEDYFDNHKELEDYLHGEKKFERYERFLEVFDRADIAYVRQHKSMPYGNGSPILAAKPYISEGESFAVLWGDDVVLAKESAIGQIKEKYLELSSTDAQLGGVIGVEEVPLEEVKRYGVVKFRDEVQKIIELLVEKPEPSVAPSRLASYGRYVLSYDIFDHLSPVKTGKDGELWLADAIHELAQDKNIYTHEVDGMWMTTGDPLRYMQTVFAYAMQREDLREELLAFVDKFKK
jgi:UTP--glucose-1-phosphate uridylyltransferase